MHEYDLLVVGSANADLVVHVDQRPAAGETVLGSDLAIHPGGKGANQAAAAARLGARTTLLARVGNDAYGRMLSQAQRAAGADTTGLLEGEDAPTGVALITVDAAGDNSIVVSSGANARLTPEDVTEARRLFEAATVVSLQLEIPRETVEAAAHTAAASGARVVLNPSPPAPLPGSVLAVCDPLVVNEHEARRLLEDPADGRVDGRVDDRATGRPEEWAEALLERGPRSVVVTLGAEGALVATPGSAAVRVPSPSVTAVDTTGAGDAFTGALGWRLGRGDGLVDAVRYAVRVGSFAVTRAGAQESYPGAEEFEKFSGNCEKGAT
ncbi:ribokinase [Streptomyces boncukensis]|uniref:Ribokinase n=1 Tax=Streptomyces boncukensis TaxID=2711219 RepID=A0A6G4WQQ9_9ACTN|nr:ribokinase [Streptomyces boncukensis]NGO67353.1 ribokinase [Streptomyces boncukensis]